MTDAKDGENDCPHRSGCVLVKQLQQTAPESGDGPTNPNSPTVASGAGCEQGDDDASREQEASDREDVETGLRGLGEANRGEVERNIVQSAKKLDSCQLNGVSHHRGMTLLTMNPWNRAQA